MKIAIAGYGAEGKANYRYFATHGHDVTVVDERPEINGLPPGTAAILGTRAFDQLQEFDMVIRTPGLPPAKLASAKKIWSATNEFFARCPAPIIGVTGTKGKGTTASLIASILSQAGKTVHLVGNIGVPAVDVLDDIRATDVVVYELSSFQLWDIEKSPRIAVVLMIEPDHLEVHMNFDKYVAAKKNIVLFQNKNDLVVYNAANTYSRAIGEASKAEKVPYQSDKTAHVIDNQFYYGEQKVCSTGVLHLPGVHNLDNACAAIDAVWPFTQNTHAIETGLAAFKGLPHRLKFVRNVDGVDYYDDSIATTPGSAVAAIQAFDQPKIIILGGSSKGSEYDAIAKAAEDSTVKAVILIGDEADKIERSFVDIDTTIINLGSNVTMKEIVGAARDQAASGDVVILSPACASFGMFDSYSDRGDQFIAAVNGLR